MENLESRFFSSEANLYFLFDNPLSKIKSRKSIDVEYKHNRESAPTEFYKSIEAFKYILMCKSSNYHFGYYKGCEADDLSYPLLKSLEGNSLCISSDLDWARNINESTHWYDWNQLWTPETFNKKWGFPATEDKIIAYKSIRGDLSDNIPPGCSNISTSLMRKLLNEYNSLEEIVEDRKKLLTKLWSNRLMSNKARIDMNFSLVSFIKKDLQTKDFLTHGKTDNELFNKMCIDLNISGNNPLN